MQREENKWTNISEDGQVISGYQWDPTCAECQGEGLVHGLICLKCMGKGKIETPSTLS